ncbi:fungal-specific transcription factor domain-containing protein [Colletotrichum navitas]|uniref:Fungal-specific transcription factor domain-containing protein n=1 Tax=Colletotrichum navitas TaxID=681940 RepID=A0AAD8V9R1_9PEZI|nr:fungal-specific transcription factor domain-containing protein [Colletotrichum navitas]KAK1597066.1 fungal-specific transcription factor domain-containing protein [Colletotrichum navitas]
MQPRTARNTCRPTKHVRTAMPDASYASNSCWTCRQKRAKCDRLLPACLRCSSLKLRCQGYDRPKKLVWTNSVASRGRMMGRATFGTSESTDKLALDRPTLPRSGMLNRLAETMQDACRFSAELSRPLIDPDLQDMSDDFRNYIRYFDLEMSKECVVYYQTSRNPFLALMPLMTKSRALSHAVVAISAFHYSHRMLINKAQPPSGEPRVVDIASLYASHDHDWQLTQPCFSPSLQTALAHKQKALEYLKSEIGIQDVTNNDAVVAAIVLFVCMDVVEFGSRGWEYHLEGAGEILQKRRRALESGHYESSPWLEYFDTAYTTFGVLGATLAPAKGSFFQRLDSLDPFLMQALRQSETQTWVGCPAELLYLISVVNSLRSDSSTVTGRLAVIRELCNSLQTFSPPVWATDFSDSNYHESRSHLAYAYKAAVEVYASQVIGVAPETDYLSRQYLDANIPSAILHMLSIPAQDFHVKSLVWPAFILGAEAQTIELRNMVRALYWDVWISSCCYNVRNAINVLERLWARSAFESASKSWLQYVWDLEDSWLFL